LTPQLAPDQVFAGLKLQFPATLRASEIEASASDIDRQTRAAHPEAGTSFIKS